ncbi:hypothetical protein TNCV_4303381 [Trichonephila clavipes]|nr:hypothetical protein TNCV_4303381 [Trichonephila clavipes]
MCMFAAHSIFLYGVTMSVAAWPVTTATVTFATLDNAAWRNSNSDASNNKTRYRRSGTCHLSRRVSVLCAVFGWSYMCLEAQEHCSLRGCI